MKTLSQYLGGFSLFCAVFGGVGYVHETYGTAWAVGAFFLMWVIGPFLPLFSGVKDGDWVLAAWVYIPAVLAVIAAMLARDRD